MLFFEWLGSTMDHTYLALLVGIVGGLVWQIEKYLSKNNN